MTATKEKQRPSTFIPGGFSYWRDDVLMVEIKPGVFVSAQTAMTFGISAVNPPKRPAYFGGKQ